ncbi:MAG: histone-lysine N-methyltransferase [Deltaproteobacteria bacterium]|jgi:isopropylmalate/homocitrate/citramalate synthase|nr:histone-lysine N-methyltransferase [Deltaproteobacteria bacterium]
MKERKLFPAPPSPRRFQLQAPSEDEPRLYRELFPYTEVPRVAFDGILATPDPAPEPLVTDTTFRDGQQARPPYTPEQIASIFERLSLLGGKNGLIRKSEFFLFNDRDRRALEACRELGREYPIITGWIRALPEDLKLVRRAGIRETGILTSISDYHIHLKLGLTRKRALDKYLGLVKDALAAGISPRCHLEDVTRADVYGCVLPFAQALQRLSEEADIPVLLRLCDTLGLGVSYPGAALPRSVPRLVRAVIEEAGIDGRLLEWHGHNDFHRAFANAVTAWHHGLGSVNGSLFGFGERTGNTPVEALLIERAALLGDADGADFSQITELAGYFERELGVQIPPNYPLAGRDFNATSAGIHADGLLKNEEIYNIFDTRRILKRPPSVVINDKSGSAGLAHWLNQRLHLTGGREVDKRNPAVQKMHRQIQKEYENGRLTSMSNRELEKLARFFMPKSFVSKFDRLKEQAREIASELVEGMIRHPVIRSMDPEKQEPLMEKWVTEIPFVQFIYVTDHRGFKTTKNVSSRGEKKLYAGKQDVGFNLSDRTWFVKPKEDGLVHLTDFYTSRFTQALCLTVSGPVLNMEGDFAGVLGLDINFEYLSKMEPEPEDFEEMESLLPAGSAPETASGSSSEDAP